jgi:hypothetical protein
VTTLALHSVEKVLPFSTNKEKSAADFCLQVAAFVPDMFCNFYLIKSHKIVSNPTTTEAIEKMRSRPGIFIIKKDLI